MQLLKSPVLSSQGEQLVELAAKLQVMLVLLDGES